MKKGLMIFLMVLIVVGIIGITSYPLFFHGEKEAITENVDEPLEPTEDTSVQETITQDMPIEETVNVKILAAGDMMFHMPQIDAARTDSNNYDFSPVFKHVKKYIEDADIAIANFEAVTAGNDLGFTGFPRFNSPTQTLLAIKEAGFDILSTANNHSLDRNKKGIINTIDVINEYGLKNIGTFKEKSRPIFIQEINGIKIGFLAYTSYLNGLDSFLSEEETFMVNNLEEELIESDINNLKAENVDVIVAYLHWGYEYHTKPADYQIILGQKMVQWGVDIILGSHPHIIQRSEIIQSQEKDKLIVYSMGNFLSNQRYETMGNSYTEDGLMVEIDLEKNLLTSETIIKEVKFIPTWIYRYKDGNGLNYEILPIEEFLAQSNQNYLPENILDRLEKSYNDTINTLKNKN